MKKGYFILLFLSIFLPATLSQRITLTGECPNSYLKVDEVYTDGVRITQTSPGQLDGFQPGDKVLIIQMTGVTLDETQDDFKTYANRSKKSAQNTGAFEILQLDDIVIGPDTVLYFTDNLAKAYDPFEKIQLVRLVEAEVIQVTGILTTKAWDGNTGGIMAMISTDSVKIANNSIIDVSGKGFRGGAIPANYTGSCRYGTSTVFLDTLYFLPSEAGRSGYKGEGVISATWPYTMGTAFNINGGGAGNGYFSGGGGGGNYSVGGDGGQQAASCAGVYSVKGGWGGYACHEIYENPQQSKAILGGGGGSGNRAGSSTASSGGSGGGMIMIITGTLQTGSSVSIRSNGANGFPSLPARSAYSGAGGGAGGTILIDADNYTGPSFNVQIRGGYGSSTSATGYGAGGSGSGGVLWHAGRNFTPITLESVAGNAGLTTGSYPEQYGHQGNDGVQLDSLMIPLNGFLFNSIKGKDTICETQIPNLLTGSQPKGGNGTYSYVWQDSTAGGNWITIAGAQQKTFQPPALNQTTWFRRIVTSDTITDVSREIEVYVYPSIANNIIMGTDTICYNLDAKLLSPAVNPAGGNGIYRYKWESGTDNVQWDSVAMTGSFDPGLLTTSTYFRRIIQSAKYCYDTSNVIIVNVLPSITGNEFVRSDTSICQNTQPDRLPLGAPGGGDGNFTFLWQTKTLLGDWNDIANTTDSTFYSPGNLSSSRLYRRIVYSGNDNACIDTVSDPVLVDVKPSISNNSILGSEIKYTCYQSPIVLSGSEPQNGFGTGTYVYTWEVSDDLLTWQDALNTNIHFTTGDLVEKKYFRRIVYSSALYHECVDTSSAVEVRINPLPTGNVLADHDTICAGEICYVKFNVSGNGPFGVFLNDASKNNITGPVDSLAFTPASTIPFAMVSITDDSSCTADPAGFIPVTPVTVYAVPVASAGADNEVCGNVYILNATKSNPAYKGLWSAPDAVFSNDTITSPMVTVNNYGTNYLTWLETNWHCFDEDEVEILFNEQPQIPEAGTDQELDFKYTTALQATPASAGSGLWTVTKGKGVFDNHTDANTTVSEISDLTTLKWTITNGNCPPVSDSVQLTVKPLIIRKGFTPDNSGLNDFFDLGAVNAENISIKVFSSSGSLVFESENYGTDGDLWYGYNMNNVELPEGTYYYVANIKVAGKTEEVQFRSFVEILRTNR